MGDQENVFLQTLTLATKDSSVTAKIYADGDVILKQDDHQVYVPRAMLSTLAHFLASAE
jgi:hypothetical protein